jgi:GNAT superfamily N-acetyltransferase
MIMSKNAITDEEIIQCYEIMSQLRPHLKQDTFLETVRSMESDGYRLAYLKEKQSIVAVTGYRIYSNLFMGKHLYVDDLVTSTTERSRGYGKSMIKWLRQVAIKNDCNYLHLDSGTQREQAHKFYFKQGFTIASFHFSEKLKA